MEREGGIAFIESLAELLRRLMDYRAVQQGDRDLHMHVMFNLLVSPLTISKYLIAISISMSYLLYIMHD